MTKTVALFEQFVKEGFVVTYHTPSQSFGWKTTGIQRDGFDNILETIKDALSWKERRGKRENSLTMAKSLV
jgi:hypothetical protein